MNGGGTTVMQIFCNIQYHLLIIHAETCPEKPVHFALEESFPPPDDGVTRVLVTNIPPQKRDELSVKSYLSMLMLMKCSVKQYKDLFMATFAQPIGKYLVGV